MDQGFGGKDRMFLNPLRNFIALAVPLAVLAMPLGFSSCGNPATDGSSALSKQAQIDAANIALTQGDCKTANVAISPVYNSANTDDNVRMIMASVFGCSAGINLIGLVSSIAQNSSLLSGSGFWGLLAELFPSTTADVVPESGEYATDALFADIYPGQVVSVANTTNATTYNPGSVIAANRIPDANTYLVFVSMAVIGGFENRYGLPNSSYKKTQAFTWEKATSSGMNGDGCGLAASVLNFFDGIEAVSTNLSGNSLTSNLNTVYSAFNAALNAACVYGCMGTPSLYNAAFSSGCSFSAAQCGTTCPLTLRFRGNCTAQTTDMNSCAAAGIIDFLNNSPLGWN